VETIVSPSAFWSDDRLPCFPFCFMTARDLHSLPDSARPRQLIEVLAADVFAAARIPGSLNACVFETAFLDHNKALALDSAAPLVVYGVGATSPPSNG
jgi:hypothetical protein